MGSQYKLNNSFRGKSVLVTGHTGFKGSWLTAWLKLLGANVTGISLDAPTVPSHFIASKLFEDIKDLSEKMNERKTDFLSNLNKVIGFMNDFKAENYAVFKIKYIDSPRVLGARCDQNSNKSKAIEILNSIVGSNVYSTQLDIPQREICIIQEFYLRIFENERKNKKHWFLSPPSAVLTNIEKFTTIVKLK